LSAKLRRAAAVWVFAAALLAPVAARSDTPLFTIDNPELRAALQTARGAALSASGAKRTANGLVSVTRGLQQVAPPQERDSALAALHSAQQQERSAYEVYRAAASGSRPEDITAANGGAATASGALQAALAEEVAALGQTTAAGGLQAQAAGAVALAQAQLADTRVRAPAAGQVTAVDINPGELAPQGYPVVSLIETAQPWATFNIPETLLPHFREGTELMLRVPALGDRNVRFRVYYVSVLGAFATERSSRTTSGDDIRTFEVRARPVEHTGDLRAGMSVVVVS